MDLTKTAVKKAMQSACHYRVSAIGLDERGQVVATACNHPRFSKYGGGKHAEMALLNKVGDKIKTILICRINNRGDIVPIHSCKRCRRVLDKKGIKVLTVSEI